MPSPSFADLKRLPSALLPGLKRSWLFALGATATLLLMANGEQLPRGPLLGMVTMLVAAVGVLHMLGLLAPREVESRPLSESALGLLPGEPRWGSPLVMGLVSLVVVTAGGIVGGVEALPWAILFALLPLAVPAYRRPGLLVAVVVALIYLPQLGHFGLWDPWETHYGEVAREILSRDDWISLWWAHEHWFWSKPIFIFWSEALSMGAFGVDFLPDANPARPEWAIRLPNFLLSMGAVLAVYAAISKTFNKRAGVLAALVLATVPHFFFLSHQAITDIPFVANMTIALCLLVMAVVEDPDREVTEFRLGRFAVSGQHALIAAVVMVALPQALYLISRNVTMVGLFQFAWHHDEFYFGSRGNSGLPGHALVRQVSPYARSFFAEPAMQGLYWLIGLGLLLGFFRKERRAQALFMFAFYLFCAFAFMGKGIPGFGLPGLIACLFLVASRRWDLLFLGRFRIAVGALVVVVVGLPWYVAMYVRHGPPFTDRLLVHDHINRLAAGVHGDTGSIEYFLLQLGYATFPWVALVPAALLGWLWYTRPARASVQAVPHGSVGAARAQAEPYDDDEGDISQVDASPASTGADAPLVGRAQTQPEPDEQRRRREALILIAVWFFTAFALFSAMITKFHHYIFPAVPPAAILVGVLLDRMFGPAHRDQGARLSISTVVALLAPILLVLGVAGLYGDVRGFISESVPGPEQEDWVLNHPWNPFVARGLVVLGGLFLVAAAVLRGEGLGRDPRQRYGLLGAIVVAAAVGVTGGTAGLLVSGALIVGVLFFITRTPVQELSSRALAESGALGATVAAGTVLVAFVGRDLSWETMARPQGYERLIHLFVYNYGRPWPVEFDYRPVLTAFAIIVTVLFGMAVFRSIRPVASRALLGLGLCFAAWTLNVYMVDLAPHWGQRELIKAYYEDRNGPDEPLLAWQMNWKGENFYTGNRVYIFVDLDNKKMKDWMAKNRGKTAYFVLEHSRLGSLRSVLTGRHVEEVTDKRVSNKFIVVKAVL